MQDYDVSGLSEKLGIYEDGAYTGHIRNFSTELYGNITVSEIGERLDRHVMEKSAERMESGLGGRVLALVSAEWLEANIANAMAESASGELKNEIERLYGGLIRRVRESRALAFSVGGK